MKTILFTLLGIALFTSSCSTKRKTDWEKNNLKGEVKSFKEITYEAIEMLGEIKKGIPRGYIYDANKFSIFNKNGSIIESNIGSMKWTFKYDDKGNEVESNIYDYDGKLSNKLIYKYDESGDKIELNSYNSDGRLYARTINKYDAKGNKIESNLYDSVGKQTSKDVFQYNDRRELIENKSYYFADNILSKDVFKYNDKGNLIEENNYMSDGTLFRSITLKYDENGNVIEFNSCIKDSNDNIHNTYKYYYDKKGNWIKQIIFVNTIPKYIKEREIEYFEK